MNIVPITYPVQYEVMNINEIVIPHDMVMSWDDKFLENYIDGTRYVIIDENNILVEGASVIIHAHENEIPTIKVKRKQELIFDKSLWHI